MKTTNTSTSELDELLSLLLSQVSGVCKAQLKFLTHLLPLLLSIKGRINFLQLWRYGNYSECAYRRNFSRTFNWLGFNKALSLQVLLPVVLGFLLHKKLGLFAEKHKGKLRVFDQIIILLIVYTSFCESFARNMFADYSIPDLLLLGLSMVALFFLVMGISMLLSRLLGFNREDGITLLFCGSKKSLVHGTVMSKVLFPDANVVGIILLPIMLYHALQLLLSGVIAQRKAREVE